MRTKGSCLTGCALRFAPVRSSGFRMPCRERAVELAGGGDAQATVSKGPVRPGAHGPLARPVLIPASPPAPEVATAKPLHDRSWICNGPVPARRDRELAATGARVHAAGAWRLRTS